jgi:hypothetical protein
MEELVEMMNKMNFIDRCEQIILYESDDERKSKKVYNALTEIITLLNMRKEGTSKEYYEHMKKYIINLSVLDEKYKNELIRAIEYNIRQKENKRVMEEENPYENSKLKRMRE